MTYRHDVALWFNDDLGKLKLLAGRSVCFQDALKSAAEVLCHDDSPELRGSFPTRALEGHTQASRMGKGSEIGVG